MKASVKALLSAICVLAIILTFPMLTSVCAEDQQDLLTIPWPATAFPDEEFTYIVGEVDGAVRYTLDFLIRQYWTENEFTISFDTEPGEHTHVFSAEEIGSGTGFAMVTLTVYGYADNSAGSYVMPIARDIAYLGIPSLIQTIDAPSFYYDTDAMTNVYIANKEYKLHTTAIGSERIVVNRKEIFEDGTASAYVPVYTSISDVATFPLQFTKPGKYMFYLAAYYDGQEITEDHYSDCYFLAKVIESPYGYLAEPEIELPVTVNKNEDVRVVIHPVEHAERYTAYFHDYSNTNHYGLQLTGNFIDDSTPAIITLPSSWMLNPNSSNYYQLDVTVSANDAYDTTISRYFHSNDFIMSAALSSDKTSVATGEAITFHYSAPNADWVSIQRKYDRSEKGWMTVEYVDHGGEGEITTTEEIPATYEYRLCASYGNEMVFSDLCTVTYSGIYGSKNYLAVPNIHMAYQYDRGEDVTITFDAVEGSESYQISVYHNVNIWTETVEAAAGVSQQSVAVPVSVFEDEFLIESGKYGVDSIHLDIGVTAIADGLNTSEARTSIHYGNLDEYVCVAPFQAQRDILSAATKEIDLFTKGADEVFLYSRINEGDWSTTHYDGDINLSFTISCLYEHSEAYYLRARFGNIWRTSETAGITVYNPYDYSAPISEINIVEAPEHIQQGETLTIVVSGLENAIYHSCIRYDLDGTYNLAPFTMEPISEDVYAYHFDTSTWYSGEYVFTFEALNYGSYYNDVKDNYYRFLREYKTQKSIKVAVGPSDDKLVEVLTLKSTMKVGETVRVVLNAPNADNYKYTYYDGQMIINQKEDTGSITEVDYVTLHHAGMLTITLEAYFGNEIITDSAQISFIEKPSDLSLLQTLALPTSLQTIEDGAFQGIPVERVILPDGLISIGSHAFANCENLIYINIPVSVDYIADDAFSGCDAIFFECEPFSIGIKFAEEHGYSYPSDGEL